MKSVLAITLTLLIAALIAVGTLTPPGDGPALLPLTDKQMHFIAFALLVLPMTLMNWRHAFWLAPLALVFGAAIELIQPTVGRSGDWLDLLADATGIVFGMLPGLIRHRRNTGAIPTRYR